MNVIVHYPKSQEAISELSKRVAEVHIEAVISKLSNTSCPHSQKTDLINELRGNKSK